MKIIQRVPATTNTGTATLTTGTNIGFLPYGTLTKYSPIYDETRDIYIPAVTYTMISHSGTTLSWDQCTEVRSLTTTTVRNGGYMVIDLTGY